MFPADLSFHISVLDGAKRCALPEWAASLVWLGAWCRANQVVGKRLVVFATLPTRELAAAFAGLGCLVAGANVFEDTLSWSTFRKFPIGRSVFWIYKSTGTRYGGDIIDFSESDGTEFIEVKVTKAAKRKSLGVIMKVSQRYFDDYRFTENEPPSVAKTELLNAAECSLGALVENLNPKWMWSDAAEGLIVTSVASFENSIADLSLSIDSKPSVSMSNLLCLGRNKDQGHAKLRVDHPRGDIEGNFPLAILDGGKAFMVHEHLSASCNILIILDRSEYQAEIHDIANTLRSITQNISVDLQGEIPEKFPLGIEIAAYLVEES